MDLQEALGSAIDFEHRVRDHYADCARKTKDVLGQKVFATMAREEQGHVEYLEARLTEWRTSGVLTPGDLPTVLPPPAWLREAGSKIAASALAPGGSAGHGGLPELDFLKEALELERKTSAFYQDMVGKLEPAHRELFSRFLDIEDGHVTLVQAEIDALVGHGHWFDFMEFRLEA